MYNFIVGIHVTSSLSIPFSYEFFHIPSQIMEYMYKYAVSIYYVHMYNYIVGIHITSSLPIPFSYELFHIPSQIMQP